MNFSRTHTHSRTRRLITFAASLAGAFLAAFFAVHVVAAFTGPTQAPPSGSGVLSVSGSDVGIGTSTPSYPLDVNGKIRSESGGIIFPDGTTQVTAYTPSAALSAGNVSAGTFGSNTGGGTYAFPSSVGIGTAAPSPSVGQLEVYNGSGGANAGIVSGNNGWASLYLSGGASGIGFSGSALEIGTAGNIGAGISPVMIVESGGDVGIGTTAPDNALTVTSGALRVSGPVTSGAANSIYLDQTSIGGVPTERVLASGPNTTSAGTLELITMSSNASVYHQAITVSPSGDVGINTGSPGDTLSVNGSANINGPLAVGVGSNVNGAIELFPDNSGSWFWIDNNGGVLRFSNGSSPGGSPMTYSSTGALSIPGQMNAASYCISGSNCITSWPTGGGATTTAANVSAGTFGANTGGGNYSFPSGLSVGNEYITVNSSYVGAAIPGVPTTNSTAATSYPLGFYSSGIYSGSGYPSTYGYLLSMSGQANRNSMAQMYFSWTGYGDQTGAAGQPAYAWVRTNRDSNNQFGMWQQVLLLQQSGNLSVGYDGYGTGNANFSGNVGIGTTSPNGQLANTATNYAGDDGNGENGNSLTWSTNAGGYTAAFVNLSNNGSTNGVLVSTPNTSSGNRLLTLDSAGTNRFSVTDAGAGYLSGTLTANGGIVAKGSVDSEYGGTAEILANGDNHTGGGIAISDDGGFFDYNDGYVTYNGSTGLKIAGNNGAGSSGTLYVQGKEILTGNIQPSAASNTGGGTWYFGNSAWGGNGPAVSNIDSVTGMIYNGGSGSQLVTLSSGPGQTSLQLDGSIFVGDNGSPYNPIGITGSSDGYLLVDNGASFGGNVEIQGKLTVPTIDPLYTINGTNYSTYGTSMTGVKEESAGNIYLTKNRNGVYKKTIDFANQPKGSDLWLFTQATALTKNLSKLIAVLTPGFNGRVWYTSDPAHNSITVYASPASAGYAGVGSATSSTLKVSYNFIAPRFDAAKWHNLAPASEAHTKGLIVP